MSAVLPETDAELIARCRAEYEAIAQQGGQEAQDACYRYAWALVHGPKKANVTLGLDLCEAMLTNGGDEDKRELLYLLAVGKYRQKKFIECRRTLKGLKEVYPDFRQADVLLESCEKEIVKDGLIGVGFAGAVVGVVAAVATVALSKR